METTEEHERKEHVQIKEGEEMEKKVGFKE